MQQVAKEWVVEKARVAERSLEEERRAGEGGGEEEEEKAQVEELQARDGELQPVRAEKARAVVTLFRVPFGVALCRASAI